MSYHDDELAPPNGDFPDALIRAASLSALLLTACSDPKPATPTTSTATELVRPADHTPEFEFIQPPTQDARPSLPDTTVHKRNAVKGKTLTARADPKRGSSPASSARTSNIAAENTPAQWPREPRADDASVWATPAAELIASDVTISDELREEAALAAATPSELAAETSAESTVDNVPHPDASLEMSSAPAEEPTAPEIAVTVVASPAEIPAEPVTPITASAPTESASAASEAHSPIEVGVDAVAATATVVSETLAATTADTPPTTDIQPQAQAAIEPATVQPQLPNPQADPDPGNDVATLNTATATAETVVTESIPASNEADSAAIEEPTVRPVLPATASEDQPPEYVYPIIETAPTAPARTTAPEANETLSAITDENGTVQLTRVTEPAPEPAAALAAPSIPERAASEPERAVDPSELTAATDKPVPEVVEPLAGNIQSSAKKDPVASLTVPPAELVDMPKVQLQPQRTAALSTAKTKRKLTAVPKELSRPPVAKEHNNTQVELLQPVPNKIIVRALTAAIAAAAQQDNAYQPEPPPPVEDADDAEWEARMQTSQAPATVIETPARVPRNLTGSDFVQNGAKDVTGNSVTLSIAALGDAPINGYFVAESIGNSKPKTPKSNDPNWQEIEPVSVFGTEQSYTLKQSYADSTPVNLHVWFKDTKGQVSPAVHSKIALHRADTVISDDAPYVVDAALGFKDWIYQRGASQMGSAPHGRAKARADADNFLLSPPLTLPLTKNDATLTLALRQWYQFGADANVSDGARATLEIATEQLPGQWSDWAELTDGDKSTSNEWTAPRFDLSAYTGSTVKFRVGVAGSLHALADWGLSELSIAPEKPIQILPHSAYAQGFEADWNGWSSRLPQWSLTGPSLDGKILASEGLYHAAAKPIGLATGEFTLNSPMFQLPSGSVDLSLSEWHSLGHGEGRLQISYFDTNTGWRPWEDLGRAITGRSATWQTLQADLTPYAGKKIRVRILARLTPNDSVLRVDEFLVVAH